MAIPVPFRISYSQDSLDDLRNRLQNTRWPENSLANDVGGGDTWEYGMPNRVAQKLTNHWLHSYSWPAWEAKLNSFSHFRMPIDVPVGASQGDKRGKGTVQLHFLHERSERSDAIPVVLVHGWPGCFVEFIDVIRPLAHPPNASLPAFHVVVPSLIGFGFSSAAPVRDFGIVQQAACINHLMTTLGYDRYISQGGDFGSHISKALALGHPKHCRAIHLNMPTYPRPPPNADVDPPTPAETARMSRAADAKFVEERIGYQRIQATKPQTLSFGVSDSPVGVLAWIGEKFHEWVDLRGGDGDFSPNMHLDHFLTNVMIYWITNTIASSFRMYHVQLFRKVDAGRLHHSRVDQPVGVAAFPFESSLPPKGWAKYWYKNLVQWSEFEKGGHFAAMECPDELVGDVRLFASTITVRAAMTRAKL
ncbi:epocide hydrolase domain-containing protein [Gonapodya prolifera JEL478]|uniref:Epocide hydrolase domain-containing protein n=1 Tax=Gonapodya prolifera (strain JEL478) TaxID=1344416 RepID=A0A139AW30_GONPJ|nr:epocide hydrolase domain-containing protein [Gonapodya prolifera JEL478]|eukprot:KXS20951.1 epocide hydrolase domain-containing protein [Gonapodya prolifera JEL478]